MDSNISRKVCSSTRSLQTPLSSLLMVSLLPESHRGLTQLGLGPEAYVSGSQQVHGPCNRTHRPADPGALCRRRRDLEPLPFAGPHRAQPWPGLETHTRDYNSQDVSGEPGARPRRRMGGAAGPRGPAVCTCARRGRMAALGGFGLWRWAARAALGLRGRWSGRGYAAGPAQVRTPGSGGAGWGGPGAAGRCSRPRSASIPSLGRNGLDPRSPSLSPRPRPSAARPPHRAWRPAAPARWEERLSSETRTESQTARRAFPAAPRPQSPPVAAVLPFPGQGVIPALPL